MRVTVAVTVDGRTATVTADVHPDDTGLDVASSPAVVLARLLEAAQEGASAEARKRKKLDPRHAWAGFLRGLRHRFEFGPEPRGVPVPEPLEPAHASSAQPPSGLDAFALAVAQALAGVRRELVPTGIGGALVPRGWFGEHKVFIAAVHRALRAAGSAYGRMSVDDFKARLIEANREGLLSLSRADLVGAMDPEEVAASLIEDRNASFHFVERPRFVSAVPGGPP